MKDQILVLTILLGGVTIGAAQEHRVWLKLTESRAVTNAVIDSLGAESAFIGRMGTLTKLPLDEILQIRVMSNRSIGNGALLGGGIGLAAGAFTGVVVKVFGGSESSPATAMAAFAVIGGMVGGTIAALEKPGEIVDLSSLDRAAKRKRIEDLIAKARESSGD